MTGAPTTSTPLGRFQGRPRKPKQEVPSSGLSKDDMVRLHALLFQMRRAWEHTIPNAGAYFEAYDKLGVSPVNLHKGRHQHREAIFLLGEALSKLVVEHVGKEASLTNQLHFIERRQAARL